MQIRRVMPLIPLLLAAPLARAQWSADETLNLAVADAVNDQVQPKVAATADGGCYISWFDALANGFDVRLQRLDASGVEQWAHNGILVADRGYSSTQDYGLAVDPAGNALLAFRDDSGASDQVGVSMVTPAGALAWGAVPVLITATTAFIAAPHVTAATDGSVYVAWTQDDSCKVQKLDPSGAAQWGAAVDMTPASGSNSASDIHATGTDVIVSMVQVGPNFWDPKHLYAQKLDANGTALWGLIPIPIFDGGSLQFGNFPSFITDGAGGAVFSWYNTAPLQCYAQHILANGTEAFPHNGSEASTNSGNTRADPEATYDPVTGETFLYWTEMNSGQSQWGIYGQKFDATGIRQWTDTGAVLRPVGSTERRLPECVHDGANSIVVWVEANGFNTETLHGGIVSATGTFNPGPFDVASTAAGKSRLDLELGAAGYAILAWSDKRTDGGDIYAQNINSDGTLGGQATPNTFCFGDGSDGGTCPCGNPPTVGTLEGCTNVTGVGAYLTASGVPSVSNDTLLLIVSQAAPTDFGIFVQNVATGSPTPFYNGLLCLAADSHLVRHYAPPTIQPTTTDAGGSGTNAQAMTLGDFLGDTVAGARVYYQYWYRDNSGPCGTGANFSSGYYADWLP